MDSRSGWRTFHEYNNSNPDLYGRLVAMALRLRVSGFKRFGIAWLFEVIRYECAVRYGEDFKIDNSLRAAYARFIMANEPKLRDAFTTRKSALDEDDAIDVDRQRPRRRASPPPGRVSGNAGQPTGKDDQEPRDLADPYACTIRRRSIPGSACGRIDTGGSEW